jgi:hypothetical protein
MTTHCQFLTRLSVFAALALALVGAGCGDNSAPLPNLSIYTGSWQEILQPDRSPEAPKELRWQAGVLYYVSWDLPAALVALPVGTGVAATPRVLSTEDAFRIWVQGDNVLYSQSETLRAVPTGGGTPVTVLMGPDAIGTGGGELIEAPDQDLDGSYYYYDTFRSGASGVIYNFWRLPRAGGSPEQLGELAGLTTYDISSFNHGPSGIVAIDFAHNVWVVPDDGSGARQFATVPSFDLTNGTDGHSVLYSDLGPGSTAQHLLYLVYRVAPDQPAPQVIWTPGPNVVPLTAFSDGAAGWIITAVEYFSDQQLHQSVWHVPATGDATRIATNPTPGRDFIRSVVVAPDAIYAGVENSEAIGSWTLVQLPGLTETPPGGV